jgi:hypothetical protein
MIEFSERFSNIKLPVRVRSLKQQNFFDDRMMGMLAIGIVASGIEY